MSARHVGLFVAALAVALPATAAAQRTPPPDWECMPNGMASFNINDHRVPYVCDQFGRAGKGWYIISNHGDPGGIFYRPVGTGYSPYSASCVMPAIGADPVFRSSNAYFLFSCHSAVPGETDALGNHYHSCSPLARPSALELCAREAPPGAWSYGSMGKTNAGDLSVGYHPTCPKLIEQAREKGLVTCDPLNMKYTPDAKGAYVGMCKVLDGYEKDGTPVYRYIGKPMSQNDMDDALARDAARVCFPRSRAFDRCGTSAMTYGEPMFACGAGAFDQFNRAAMYAQKPGCDPNDTLRIGLHTGAGTMFTGGALSFGSTGLSAAGMPVLGTRVGALACRTPATAACVVTAATFYYIGHTVSSETCVGDGIAICLSATGEFFCGDWDFRTTQCLAGYNPDAKPIRKTLTGPVARRPCGGSVQNPVYDPPYEPAVAAVPSTAATGCACRLDRGAQAPTPAAWLVALAALVAARRRRRA
jgi:MYXO-CTERM domain-containing protein